jgi:hypothetical protein
MRAGRRHPRFPLLLPLLLLPWLSLSADVVVLKDGKTVEGTVTDAGDSYTVKTKYGTLSIQKEEVEKVIRPGKAPSSDLLPPVAPPKAAPVKPPTPPAPPTPAGAPAHPAADPDTGLLAHWKLDDGAGGTARDASACGRDGTLKGGAEWTDDGIRRGLHFDGATGYVETPLSPDITRPFSLAFHVKPGGTQRRYATVIGNHLRGPTRTRGVSIHQTKETPGSYWVIIGTGGEWSTSKPFPLPAGTWRHVAAVCDGRETVVYLDGAEVCRTPLNGHPRNHAQTLKLGQGCYPNLFFNGTLSDVRVYARTLSEEEIARLAKAAPDRRPVVRTAAPEGAALADARREIKSLFKDGYASREASARIALARALLRAGTESKEDDALRYAAFDEARDVAAAAGDLETALAAIDRLGAAYDVDAPDLKAEAAQTAARTRDPEAARRILETGLDLTERLERDDAYAAALKAAAALESLARRLRDAAFVRTLQLRTKALRAGQSAWNRIRASAERLKDDPDDAAACLTMAKYRATQKDDWEAALPLFAKGGHAGLAEAAKADLAGPADADARAAAGDRWWALAEKERVDFKDALRARARHHYLKALPGLTGLAKTRVEKRIEEVARAMMKKTALPPGCVLFLDFETTAPAGGRGAKSLPLRDRSGAGNHATLSGGRLLPGPRGRCVEIKGPSVIKLDRPLEVGPAWTIAWHMNFDIPWAPARRSLTTNGPWHHHVLLEASGALASAAATSVISTSDAKLTALKGWHHVAAVGRGGVTVFYIDGREAGRTKSQETGPIQIIGNYLSGSLPVINPMDDFMVFRTALTADMILLLARR